MGEWNVFKLKKMQSYIHRKFYSKLGCGQRDITTARLF